MQINTLDNIPPLSSGAHDDLAAGACVMEAVSYIAGEPWSDHPQCVCPVIAAFCRTWNDNLPDDQRDALLRPLIPLLIGTRGTPALEQQRAFMAADWACRVAAPAALRAAGLAIEAATLEALPPVVDDTTADAARAAAAYAADAADAAAAYAAARAAAAYAAYAARAAANAADAARAAAAYAAAAYAAAAYAARAAANADAARAAADAADAAAAAADAAANAADAANAAAAADAARAADAAAVGLVKRMIGATA
jgi:hypothetical protein